MDTDDPRRDLFLEFLGQGADFLDRFGRGLDEATDRLGNFNLPRGFRADLAAFQNADLGRPFPGALPFTGPLAFQRGTDGAALPSFRTERESRPGISVEGGLHVHVTVPGGVVTPQTKAQVEEAVVAHFAGSPCGRAGTLSR
ncbi:MAG: hypothetical protein H0T68_14235 [Gemmatimonadales bacterium]|nr:hypothetical protein [Gemmatimonadales bacterium]